jgi:hypothetical protein
MTPLCNIFLIPRAIDALHLLLEFSNSLLIAQANDISCSIITIINTSIPKNSFYANKKYSKIFNKADVTDLKRIRGL